MDDNIIVHGLWIGEILSPIELLCIHSFIANGHEFHLWTYDTLKTHVPHGTVLHDASVIISRDKAFFYKNKNQFGHGKGSFAGFSDIFRYKLLYKKGGWWVDMDIVCLKPLNFPEPYVFRTHHEFRVVGNIMKCPAGSQLMKNCYNEAILKVTADNQDWNLPIRILNDSIDKFGLNLYVREFTNRDSWLYVRKLLFWKVHIPEHWAALHLVNEEWRRNNINRNAILKRSHIGVLLNKYKLWEPATFYHYLLNILRLIVPKFSRKQLIPALRKMSQRK